MRGPLFLLAILTYTQWTVARNATFNCGKLDESHVYNSAPVTALDEFPWIGRVFYRHVMDKSIRDFVCIAVLVSKRHLLSTAHCLLFDHENHEVDYVLLGDSFSGNMDTQPDCDASGKCAPLPKGYLIEDIAIHPSFKFGNRRVAHDIAIIQLTREVALSDYIQPICLPPANVYTANLRGQYFVGAGFLNDPVDDLRSEKVKIVTHIYPRGRCTKQYQAVISDDDICSKSLTKISLLSGSPLMGFTDEEDSLRSYYILGLMHSYGSNGPAHNWIVSTRVSLHINWIMTNINRRRGPIKERIIQFPD